MAVREECGEKRVQMRRLGFSGAQLRTIDRKAMIICVCLTSLPNHRSPFEMSLLSNPFDPAREAALVTGAGNGIGRAIAQALVGEGVRTVFADMREDTVKAAVADSPRAELAGAWGGE